MDKANKILKWIKAKIWWLLGLLVISFCTYVGNLIIQDREQQFEQDVINVMLKNINNPIMTNKFLTSEEVVNFVDSVRIQTRDDLIQKDTVKVKLSGKLSKALDCHPDNVVKRVVNSIKDTDFIKQKLDSIIDYRVDQKLKQILRGQNNLRRI